MNYWRMWNAFWNGWKEAPAPCVATTSDASIFLATYGTQIVCVVHSDRGCSYLSPNFSTITGLDNASCLQGGLFTRIHPDFHERLRHLLSTQPQAAKPHQFRCKLQHHDQQWYWYQFMIRPERTVSGELVCIIENIHEQMHTQHTLQKARLEAELALRARSEFLANMSHELRTPLNAVIGFSEIIESEIFGRIENQHYLEYIRHIQESGYDLLAKIEDLLEISNIDAGRVTLNKDHVLAGDILRQVISAQAHHASMARITLRHSPLREELPLYVDRLKLQHILGHLVANAIKFTPAGGCITLSAEQHHNGLAICVHDSGNGMSITRLEQITAILQEENCWMAQHKRAQADNAVVIGLGLALAKEFAALHGGGIHITSASGMGTTVEVSLPKECIQHTPHHGYVHATPLAVN